jgi:hypothetical protein
MPSQRRDRDVPLEQELAGLPELERFASDRDRAEALRAVHRRLENPYTAAYWFWVVVLVCVAIAVARMVGWSVTWIGAPAPFPAALAIVAGIAVYVLSSGVVIRWAARPELERELAARGDKARLS